MQAKRSISCRGGLTVQAVAASGPAAPEPGQSRPADQRFIQLALPFEGRARRVVLMSSFSATTANCFIFVDSLGPAMWVRLADGTVIVTKDLFEEYLRTEKKETRSYAASS